MMTLIISVAIVGFCISFYTYLLEKKVKENPTFKPVCDLSDRISCTKPMFSPYANLFYFSNAFVGMMFYVFVAILALFHAHTLLFVATLGGCLVSLVFAYLLYFKIKTLCLLCTSMYIINILLLVLSYKSL